MFGTIAGIAGGIFGGPAGAMVGNVVGKAIDGGNKGQTGSREAAAFDAALSGFAMQIASDTLADFQDAMDDTEQDLE